MTTDNSTGPVQGPQTADFRRASANAHAAAALLSLAYDSHDPVANRDPARIEIIRDALRSALECIQPGPIPGKAEACDLIAGGLCDRLVPAEGPTADLARLLAALRPLVADVVAEGFDMGVYLASSRDGSHE